MLIQFTVKNFRSIKNELILSMIAGQNDEHNENLIQYKNEKILPSVAIFGANAAGKTNIFKALDAAIRTIVSSNGRQINEKMPWIIPFLFDKKSAAEPTDFDFIFTVNGKKYQYGFKADDNVIYEEYLYEYKTARASLIFERENVDEFSFTQNTSKLKELVSKNSRNKLFLATATSWNSELTREAYLWLSEKINVFEEDIVGHPAIMDSFENENESLKPFIKTLLKNADINIYDYSFESRDTKGFPPFFNISLPDEIKNSLTTVGKEFKISTTHRFKNSEGTHDYELPMKMESAGTERLFFLGPVIKHALDRGKTIVMDEIDNSLHPLLMDYIIEIFNNRESNPNGAQLIFNTHSMKSLNLDIFRRDQIYFVNKDVADGSTELYSLDEFSVRKKENIYKNYLLGRYGAIPNIGYEDLPWQKE